MRLVIQIPMVGFFRASARLSKIRFQKPADLRKAEEAALFKRRTTEWQDHTEWLASNSSFFLP